MFVVKFVAKMDVSIFKYRDGILYKYVVFSRWTEEVGNPYEILYGAPRSNEYTNRMLKVPVKERYPGGMHMYNFVIPLQ